MSSKSGQRFIKENRAPRVDIEYEVQTNNAVRKESLPFVMGVMSDLSGQSKVERKPVSARDFQEFDMTNFEQKMRGIAPRAVFQVQNTLTGEGKLGVDLTFNSMDDFSPGAIARNVEPLAKLLEARDQLRDLLQYMDGKDGAQDLLDKVMKDPELMKALASKATPDERSEG